MGEAAKKLDPEEEALKPKLRLVEDRDSSVQMPKSQNTYDTPNLQLLDEEETTGADFDDDVFASQERIHEGVKDEDIFGKTKKELEQENLDKNDDKDKSGNSDDKPTQDKSSDNPNQQPKDNVDTNNSSGPVVDNFNQKNATSDNLKQDSPASKSVTAGNADQNKSDFQPGGGPALTANPGKKDITAPPADNFAKNKPGLDDSRAVSKAKMAKLGTKAIGKAAQGDIGGAAEVLEEAGEKIIVKGAGKAAKAAALASGVGAFAAGIADKAASYAAEKLLPIIKKWAIPFAGANIAMILLISAFIVAIIGIAFFGGVGKTLNMAARAFNLDDVNNANIILGSQQSLVNYKSFYLNQGHKDWGNVKAHASNGWKPGRTYSSAGCAITSCTMIAKYYGMSNATPPMLGELIAQKTGSMALDKGVWLQWMKENGLNKKLVAVKQNVDSIRKEIQAGNPILAQGIRAFGASGQHWVVIVGVSDDGKYLILNDPSASKRGKAGRPSPTGELGNKIKGLWALRDI